jgi:cytidylate kinase
MSDVPVITLDGPSGAGKGSVALALARTLGWHSLDSGALYRALAHSALVQGLDLGDYNALTTLAARLDVRFKIDEGSDVQRVYLGDEEITVAIREEQCGNAASKIAANKGVREALLPRQRKFRELPGLIADGRDMGTVVFFDAPLKIFLSADPDERANRRYKQLIQQGFSVNLARLSAEIADRDIRDEERSVSPLKPASDAIVIDTTEKGIDEVVQQILDLAKQVFPEISNQLSIN